MIEYARLTPGPASIPGARPSITRSAWSHRPGSGGWCRKRSPRIRLRHGGGGERADDPAAGRTIAALRRDGLAVLPEPVPGTTVDRIVAFFAGAQCSQTPA